ncbi:zinc finger protein [Branchiostoma belcheri]|nr:zinc finger protein [Branchiostoma belcheri]
MSKFARRRSLKITFLELDNAQLKDVIDLLTAHGVSTLEIQGIQRKSKESCEVTFKAQATLQRVSPALQKDRSIDVETYGNGITLVTAIGIPVELDDNYIRLRLKEYGVVLDGIFLTHANQGFPDILTGTRQYKMKLSKHLPNTIRVGQDIVSFRYAGQPKLCHRCGGEDHFVTACKADTCWRCHGQTDPKHGLGKGRTPSVLDPDSCPG